MQYYICNMQYITYAVLHITTVITYYIITYYICSITYVVLHYTCSITYAILHKQLPVGVLQQGCS